MPVPAIEFPEESPEPRFDGKRGRRQPCGCAGKSPLPRLAGGREVEPLPSSSCPSPPLRGRGGRGGDARAGRPSAAPCPEAAVRAPPASGTSAPRVAAFREHLKKLIRFLISLLSYSLSGSSSAASVSRGCVEAVWLHIVFVFR